MIETEKQISTEAKFYISRLIELFETRNKAEVYPLEYYSADMSDIEGSHPQWRGVHINQLKEGIKKGIFSSYRMLHTLGYGFEADMMIDFDRRQHKT